MPEDISGTVLRKEGDSVSPNIFSYVSVAQYLMCLSL